MLKNISKNVKCVKVRFAKIILSSASFCPVYLDCRENYKHVNGDNSTALFSLKYLFFFYPKMSGHTQHSSDHTPVANKKDDGQYQFFLSQNGSVQSYYIQAIFALEVKVGMRKTIPQKKTGSYLCERFMLLSQKVFPGLPSNGHFQRGNTFASVVRVARFKHGKLNAFTNYRK